MELFGGAHCYATNHGLEKWVTHQYEHLGWMTLAQKHGNHDKLLAFICANERLIDEIKEKMTQVSEKDRRDDLETLLWKAEHLNSVSKKMFPTKAELISHIKKPTHKKTQKNRKIEKL